MNGDGAGSGNLADQLVNSALRYCGQAPLVDSWLAEIGLNGGDIHGFAGDMDSDDVSKTKLPP